MFVWVPFVEVGAAQVAEMGIALETNHVVTSMSLLGPGVTSRAGLCVQLHVVLRSPFLGCKFEL